MKTKISFILPDKSQHVWEASKSKADCLNVVRILSKKGILSQSIKAQVLPYGEPRLIGNNVKDLVNWHSCDLEITVESVKDGRTPFEVTYARTQPKKENCRKA